MNLLKHVSFQEEIQLFEVKSSDYPGLVKLSARREYVLTFFKNKIIKVGFDSGFIYSKGNTYVEIEDPTIVTGKIGRLKDNDVIFLTEPAEVQGIKMILNPNQAPSRKNKKVKIPAGWYIRSYRLEIVKAVGVVKPLNQVETMRWLLNELKNGADESDIVAVINVIKSMGYKWDELNTILTHGKATVKSNRAMIKSDMEQREAAKKVKHLHDLKGHIENSMEKLDPESELHAHLSKAHDAITKHLD